MSQISLKSISGITSITTPAGVDNVFTVHTNDTTEKFRIDQTGNQNISGIVTASAFHGDGSQLTGIIADKIFEGNTEVETIDTGSNGHIKFTTEGTEKVRITSGGQVNIGGNFTETSHPLNVSDSTKPSLALHTGTDLRADFSATTGITSIRSYANSPFTINIGGSGETEALRITGDGKLGVGELSPSNALHISGTTGNIAGGLLRLDATTGDNFILYDNTHDNTEWAVGNDSSTRGNFDFWYNSGSGYSSNPIVRFNTSGVIVQGNTVADNNTLSAISKTASSDTYEDVFVYDTRKDSDGGAWRHRTTNTSWYNETLNTSIRGARREFPQVAIIAVGNSFIHILDADDPDMPMWMEFPAPSGGARNVMYGTGNPGCVFMLNGILATGSQSASHWPVLIDFIRDDILGLRAATGHNHYNGRRGNISLRNSATSDNGVWWPDTVTGGATNEARYSKRWWFDGLLVNKFVTSVVMDVRPEAPIDKTTGMQIPTIYFGTRGGVTIIHSNVGDLGTSYNSGFYDITSNNAAYSAIGDITITEEGFLWGLCDSYNSFATYRDSVVIDLKRLDNQMNDIVTRPDTDTIVSGLNNQAGGTPEKGREYYWVSTGNEGGTNKIGYNNTWAANIVERNAWGCAEGFALHTKPTYYFDHKENVNFLPNSDANRGLVAMITKDYNTGWHMTGTEISTCYIADGLTTNIPAGAGEMLDRGHGARQIDIVGGLTRAKCATGSDLSCVSGFSSNNYARIINQSINAGNPIDVTMMGWIKITDISGYSYLCSISNGSDNMGIAIHNSNASHGGVAYFYDSHSGSLQGNKSINDGEWHHVCGIYSSNGNRKLIYIDGVRQDGITNPSSKNYSDLDTIAIGHWCGADGLQVTHSCKGSLALVKIGLSDLTDQQVKKIYEDEKKLFQPNAKAFLYGSSNAITAIGYDEKKEIYHVGTSSGRSDFSGLGRINNTTTAVTTAISAYDGLIAEQ